MTIHEDAEAIVRDLSAAMKVLADKAQGEVNTANANAAHWEEEYDVVLAQYEQHMRDEHQPVTPTPTPSLTENFVNLDGWLNPYHGSGAYSIQGVRLKQNVECANGVLTVHTRPTPGSVTLGSVTVPAGGYCAGGIMHKTVLTPGTRIALDLRMNASVGTRAVALLWPHNQPWPAGGELDFIENGGHLPDRQSTEISNHYQDAGGAHKHTMIGFGPHDFTQWSHVEMDWTDKFVVRVDDKVAATITDHMPPGPMKLAIQTAVAGGGHSPTFNGAKRTPGTIQIRTMRFYNI